MQAVKHFQYFAADYNTYEKNIYCGYDTYRVVLWHLQNAQITGDETIFFGFKAAYHDFVRVCTYCVCFIKQINVSGSLPDF